MMFVAYDWLQTLSTAVVQVYLADQTSGNGRRWGKKCTGVITLIKDNENKSYYIRVYNVKVGEYILQLSLKPWYSDVNLQRNTLYSVPGMLLILNRTV